MPVLLCTVVGSGNDDAVTNVVVALLMSDIIVLALPPVNVTFTLLISITSPAVAVIVASVDVTLEGKLSLIFKNITLPVSVVVQSPSVSA